MNEHNIYAGPTPRILGASVYALNLTFGLAPSRDAGTPEIVTEVLNDYSGLIKTDAGHIYANGDFGILQFSDAATS